MSAGKATEVTAEKGFGTGLRAQLAARRPADEAPGAGLPGALSETLAQLEGQNVDSAVVEQLRAELEASFAREQALQTALAKLEPSPGQDAAASSNDLRAIELALEERERELAQEREQMAEERATLGNLEAELTQAKVRSDELEKQIETKVTQLKEADNDRKRLERELRVREADIAARHKGLAAQKQELEKRELALGEGSHST